MDTSSTEQITKLLAQLDEADSLIDTLRNRCAALNIEIRLRDQRIAELEATARNPHRMESQPDVLPCTTDEGASRG